MTEVKRMKITAGEKIRLLAKRKGKTMGDIAILTEQSRLADEIGVSSEVVSKWEHDYYRPDELNMELPTEKLGLSLLEDEGSWGDGCLFKEDHMSVYLKGRLDMARFPNSSKALSFAKEKHEGTFRKPEELGIPYIIHPFTMTCHALAMGLDEDVLLAALLLHDVCEDCGVAPSELPVCSEVQELVRLVTKPKNKEDFSEAVYYNAILQNPKACMVKCIDRCNNVSGMALAFKSAKLNEYIRETEEWYPQILKVVKDVPEYSNAAWLLSYQIRSILQTAKQIG